MLKALYKYSAMHAKTAAMRAKHLSEAQYEQLRQCETVEQAFSYLKTETVYKDFFADYSASNIHRGDIEHSLERYFQTEVQKLYAASPRDVQEMLTYLFSDYEIERIQRALRCIFAGTKLAQVEEEASFFAKKLTFDAARLGACTSLPALLEVLGGTPYAALLKPIVNAPSPSLFQAEVALDIYRFRHLWQLKDKALSGEDARIFEALTGYEADMQNLLWLYRQKRYYPADAQTLYTAVIPIHYLLPKQTLMQLVETSNVDAFIQLAKQTAYADLFAENTETIEQRYYTLLRRRAQSLLRKNPFSVATVLFTVEFLRQEIRRITRTIETIRYGKQQIQ